MALQKFRAPALPDPPQAWDRTYMRQFIRVLELYFSQLDGNSPNYAESYTADYFSGALMARKVTTAEKLAIPLVPDTPERSGTTGLVVFDTGLQKLCVLTAMGWQTITSV